MKSSLWPLNQGTVCPSDNHMGCVKQEKCLPTCTKCHDSDQPTHVRYIILVFVLHSYILYYSMDSVGRQWRCWSDCAGVQADLDLCYPHTIKDIFSHGVVHMMCLKCTGWAGNKALIPLGAVWSGSTVNILKFQTLYSILFWPKFCFFMQSFLKILSRMTNSVDPDQAAPSGAVRSGSALFVCAILSEALVFEILGHLPYSVSHRKCKYIK